MITSSKIKVVVAGVPRSLQHPDDDGRWLSARHGAQIKAVSERIELTHTCRKELEADAENAAHADILLVELGGDPWYRDEIPEVQFAELVSPRLRWVQACSSGVGHILETGLLAGDVLLTNASGVHSEALAESVLAAILFNAKRLIDRLGNQQTKTWTMLDCRELKDQTLCVLGTGHIGTEIAKRAAPFGMRVVGVRRRPRPAPGFDTVVGPNDLETVLPGTDYLVIACPLTEETQGMIGAAEFQCLKPGAYLINISRGKVIQEQALRNAVAAGTLSGAFLDAHAQEPLPEEHPFWTTPGITVVPHDSHSSPYIGDNIVNLFVDNLRRYLSGEPLRNVIDKARGY